MTDPTPEELSALVDWIDCKHDWYYNAKRECHECRNCKVGVKFRRHSTTHVEVTEAYQAAAGWRKQ